jgi:hypothetical protein
MASVTFQAEEVEREKKLILEGKIPVEEASKELMKHPVFKISKLTKKIIEEKRTKVSVLKRFPEESQNNLSPGKEGKFRTGRLVPGKSVVILFSNFNTLSMLIPLI